MSEQINNRAYRKEVIKQIISQLHEGKNVDEVKKLFEAAFDGVSATEISEAEQALVAEGLPISEVQRLCDVHAAAFKDIITETPPPADTSQIPGHPANTLKWENRHIENLIEQKIQPYISALPQAEALEALKAGFADLVKIDLHYLKKENLLFPYMERHGITAPPKVMWGVDDEIRGMIKDCLSALSSNTLPAGELKTRIENATEKVIEMIFKEENIMLPMLLDTLTRDEWKRIADESMEIGFLVDNVPVWAPAPEEKPVVEAQKALPGVITMPSGVLTTDELIHMLNTMPFDITFVDKNDVVKYFSESSERIFPRTKAVIGRNVSNCHPPASVHIVEKIVDNFKTGKKDHEDFWINMGERYILIRYFAVRNAQKEYLGVLEVTQNIKPIQEITGENRLMSQ